MNQILQFPVLIDGTEQKNTGRQGHRQIDKELHHGPLREKLLGIRNSFLKSDNNLSSPSVALTHGQVERPCTIGGLSTERVIEPAWAVPTLL
jgi:hypothetical protein